MPRYLQDVKIIDLSQSEWDKKASNPKNGEYVFTVKKFCPINYSTDKKWFFSWAHYDPRDQLKSCRDWQVQYNYSFVTLDDPFWPEGLPPNAEGRYVFRDAVLMKRPLVEELKDRKANRDRANMMVGARVGQFQAAAKNDGIELDDQMMRSLMGEPPK
jgi:hypothetical protein